MFTMQEPMKLKLKIGNNQRATGRFNLSQQGSNIIFKNKKTKRVQYGWILETASEWTGRE